MKISSVLVANRGEIARRVFRTCRDLGLSTVAVHSDADTDAPFVTEADRAVRLPGDAPADTYLRGDLIIDAALAAGADAVHPGYGFLSENSEFARQVIDAGLTWIGPAPETIEEMGSKIRAKELMSAAGVPTLEVDPKRAQIDDFPLLVKASAGGGGRGMRIVTGANELEREMATAAAEAQSAFGDPTVFVEPYLPHARHVEVQIVADAHGTIWVVGDRDCSIQRRHQKVIEEAPAPHLSDATRATLHEAARAAADAVNYLGAGTVEFLVDKERVYFLEMNTRLQVEHPVTEEIFGVDLVAAQIDVAEGEPLGPLPSGPKGHAVEIRLYAEDPADDWAPQTGTLRSFDIPTTDGIRVDSAVEVGSTVGIHYDAMIAKVIAHGRNRHDAIRRLAAALRRSRVHGLQTNIDLLQTILSDEEFVAGQLSTSMLDERQEKWVETSRDDRSLQKAAAAAVLAQAEAATADRRVLTRIPPAFRNVPSQPRSRTLLAHGAVEITVQYSGGREGLKLLGTPSLTILKTSPTEVVMEDAGVSEVFTVTVDTASVDVDGPDGSFSFGVPASFTDPADVVAEGSLLAPMPASVVNVAVVQGQHVSRGDVVVVLEAMKMQHTITSPTSGVVAQLSVSTGVQVESGAVLAVIADDSDDSPETAPH